MNCTTTVTFAQTPKRRARIDLTGRDHGAFTVLHEAEPITGRDGKKKLAWVCECKTCGVKEIIRGDYIRSGQHKYCDACWDNRPDAVARREEMAAELNALAGELGVDMHFTESSLLATYKEIKPLLRR